MTNGSDSTILVRVLDQNGAPVGELSPPPVAGAEQQALLGFKRRTKDIPLDVSELSARIREITVAVQNALEPSSTTSEKKHGIQLDSFKIGLTVSASGKVVLVGELGVEASIEVTFKRNP